MDFHEVGESEEDENLIGIGLADLQCERAISSRGVNEVESTSSSSGTSSRQRLSEIRTVEVGTVTSRPPHLLIPVVRSEWLPKRPRDISGALSASHWMKDFRNRRSMLKFSSVQCYQRHFNVHLGRICRNVAMLERDLGCHGPKSEDVRKRGVKLVAWPRDFWQVDTLSR